MALDPRLYSARRELCQDCGAVDGDGNPTACQQGCPASYISSLPARRRKAPKRKAGAMRWRSTTLSAPVELVLQNMEWILSLPKDSIRVEIDSGRPLASIKIMNKRVSLEAMKRFRAPGFRTDET